jgi:hypothetical protein
MAFSLSSLASKRKKVQLRNCFVGCVAMHSLPTVYLAAWYRAIPGDASARAAYKPSPATTFSIDLDHRAATQQVRAGRGELTH